MSFPNQSPALIMRALLGAIEAPLLTAPSAGGNWPAYIATLPDSDGVKQNVIALFDEEGVKQGKLQRTSEVIERFSVQILVRSPDYSVGWTKLRAIAEHLDAVSRIGIDTGSVLYFIPNIVRGTVLSVGQDTNSKKPRHLFSLNTNLICAQSAPYEEWAAEIGAPYYLKTLVQLSAENAAIWFPA